MKSAIRHIGFAALMYAVAMGPIQAQSPGQLPPVQKYGSVEYVSGGVGDEEIDAFKSASKQWPLTLELSAQGKPRAVFIADVSVQIRDAAGQIVLQTTTKGPYLLARLAPGQYDIDAIYKEQRLRKRITVPVNSSTSAILSWPGTSADSAK